MDRRNVVTLAAPSVMEGGPRRSRKTRQGCDALAAVIRPHAVLAQLLSARGKWSG